MIQLASTNTITQSQGVKVVVYGPAGAGKTVLCSTAPNPVILSAEGGLLSLRKHNLPYIEIKGYKDLTEAYKWAMQSNEAKQFETICLDSISEIGEIVLADLKRSKKDARQAYGELQDEMLSLVRQFRDMPTKHVYFSAKEDESKDGATGAIFRKPMMPGNQLPKQIPYFFDEVFQLHVYQDQQSGQQMRALRTLADFQYSAKDRSGALDPWEMPDLSNVFNKIRNG